MLYFFQQLLNGLHSAALYGLLAFGYVLISGLTHRTNLAHGAVFAFSGQTMILAAVYGWNVLWLTLPATVAFGLCVALAYAALIGFVLARSVFEPLAQRSANTFVAASLGAAIALGEAGRIAADTRDLWLPPLLSEPVVFAADGTFRVTLTTLQLINCAVACLTVATGACVLARTAWGRNWRAVSDDPQAAAMLGRDVRLIFRATVVFGSVSAALAGVLAGLYFGNISFGTGLVFSLKVLFVAAAGGFRAPALAALGAAAFGFGESLWSGYFPIEWRDAWMFVFLAAILILRRQDDFRERP
ncbi:MAG: branched-chain amino acid ABC transporter permease [Rhizobiaceae bacterium]|nr:branched-chain amino acid ABC transporter permease [Rhizobiaceae bacterium]